MQALPFSPTPARTLEPSMATSARLADSQWRARILNHEGFSRHEYAAFALNQVSRTFALNIRILPQPLQLEVTVAYLLCRIADTVEDDRDLPQSQKRDLLNRFAELFPDAESGGSANSDAVLAFSAALPTEWSQSQSWDRFITAHLEVLFPLYDGFPAGVRGAIARCVREMSSGMGHFAQRQGFTRDGKPLIHSLADLDQYCYYVAGTVGLLLCELFTFHSRLIDQVKARALRSLAVSFGLGLQLTNILKDMHEDRSRNVSFLPQEWLQEENLNPQTFLAEENRVGAERIWGRLLVKAKHHLEDAMEYSCLLPRLEPRLRLFCLWPLFMAAETLVLLAQTRDSLKQGVHLKISREQVRRIVRDTSLRCWSNRLIRARFAVPMRRLEAILAANASQA